MFDTAIKTFKITINYKPDQENWGISENVIITSYSGTDDMTQVRECDLYLPSVRITGLVCMNTEETVTVMTYYEI